MRLFRRYLVGLSFTVSVFLLLLNYHYFNSKLTYIYIVFSFLSIYYYKKDKQAARMNTWRVSESKLHLLSLLGGWPGALIAQRVLRHKTSKKSFRWKFWLGVVLNLSLVIALLGFYPELLAKLWGMYIDPALTHLNQWFDSTVLPRVNTLYYQFKYAF